MNTEASVENVKALQPYAIFNATGGTPITPKIPGYDLPNVYTPDQVLRGDVKFEGKKIAVIGSGMTGLETAEFLSDESNDIVVVEMAEKLAPGTWNHGTSTRWTSSRSSKSAALSSCRAGSSSR